MPSYPLFTVHPATPVMRSLLRVALLVALLAVVMPAVMSQPHTGLYDQSALAALLERQGDGDALMSPEQVRYRAYVLSDPDGNSVFARHRLYHEIGEGDVYLGRERLALSMLLNGVRVTQLSVGDSLILPERPEDFDLDPLSFSSFPLEYPAAADYDRLVVIDKDAQAWAAYERGQLTRWGPASTGAHDTPTPNGRFTFNWQQEERISTESPPGEEWHMRWVMNFHFERGIHLHQYALPTGLPEGAGCVRVAEVDARWIYDWAEPWTTTAGRGVLGGRVLQEGSTVLVIGDEPEVAPEAFVFTADGPVRHVVSLPEDPAAVPRGDR